MKYPYYLYALILAVCWQPATAQTSRDQAEAHTLYRQANSAPTKNTLRAALTKQSTGFLGDGTFQLGALRTFDGRYRPVPGVRFHAGLRLVEAQDSIDGDSTHLWPVGSLRGFDLGEIGGTGATALRRFRTRLVKEGSAGTRREYVEVLTAVDTGPLLLVWLYNSGAAALAGRISSAPLVLVGPGNETTEALRPLDLNQADVLRLFGKRADDLRIFASIQHLQYTQPTDVARMIDHYNRMAIVR
ncbi:hypothetical protein [Hymenobacter terrenus]|uniref:hypothetical protein n=1 Tax=Hymenobacter terrenus TaxID=1629124 RepID=UPI0006196D4C|nr:hypothetical protein [Hymenobacter terrenus]